VFHHRHERLEFRSIRKPATFCELHATIENAPDARCRSVVDEDVAEPREAGAEGLDRLGIRFTEVPSRA